MKVTSAGCNATLTTVADVTQTPAAITIGSNSPLCEGDNLSLASGSTTPGVQYAWTGPNNFTANVQNPSINGVTTLAAGMYHLTVSNGSCLRSDSVSVAVGAYPSVNLGNDTQICTSAHLILNAGNPGSSYLWNTNDTSQTISVNTSSNYSVAVSAPQGCTSRDTILVTTVPGPEVHLGNDTVICPGVSITLHAGNPGTSYIWNTSDTSESIAVNTSGIYYVTVTNTTGCFAADTIQISQGSNPVVNLGVDTFLCPGKSITLNAQHPNHTYLWNNNATTQTITVSIGSTYSVEVTDGNHCKGSDTIEITPASDPIVELGNDTSFCTGSQIILDATNPLSVYSWGQGEITPTLTVTTSGTYYVTVTNIANCKASDTTHIIVKPLPSVDSIAWFNTGNPFTFVFIAYNPQHVQSRLWTFGDGGSDTSTNPTHTYTNKGNYNVRLVLFGECGNDTVNYLLPLMTQGVNNIAAGFFTIYPNPAREFIVIDNKQHLAIEQVSLINSLGAIVYNDSNPTRHTEKIMLGSQLSNGVYYLRIKTETGVLHYKLEISR